MKKTLAAVAVLGAFAGSALAADVTLYGRIDTGFQYHHWDESLKVTGAKTISENGDEFSMESGSLTGSRVGIKGSEQISEGLTVGFTLEKGFKGDTGSAASGFDRESSLHVKTDFGTVYAGRFNSMWSDGGPTGFWASDYMALGTGNGVALGAGLMVGHSRADNRLAYVSPEFGGFKVYAEYAFGGNGEDENTSKNDRPAALGVNYNAGAFGAGLVVTYLNEKSWIGETETSYELVEHVGADNPHYDVVVDEEGKPAHGAKQENEITVNLGTHYDFGVANVKLGVQYFKNADQGRIGAFSDMVEATKFKSDELEGYAVGFGADFPLMGGTLTAGVGYMDGEDKTKNSKVEFKAYDVASYYQYPLSKRTKVYAGVGYSKLEAEDEGFKAESEAYKAMTGLAHYF